MTLQELPKSKYVQVIGDLSVTARVNYEEDAKTVESLVISTQSDLEPILWISLAPIRQFHLQVNLRF